MHCLVSVINFRISIYISIIFPKTDCFDFTKTYILLLLLLTTCQVITK